MLAMPIEAVPNRNSPRRSSWRSYHEGGKVRKRACATVRLAHRPRRRATRVCSRRHGHLRGRQAFTIVRSFPRGRAPPRSARAHVGLDRILGSVTVVAPTLCSPCSLGRFLDPRCSSPPPVRCRPPPPHRASADAPPRPGRSARAPIHSTGCFGVSPRSRRRWQASPRPWHAGLSPCHRLPGGTRLPARRAWLRL